MQKTPLPGDYPHAGGGRHAGGWRIRRCGPLFDANAKTVNATEFLQNLEACLENYCKELGQADWDYEVWENLRKKKMKTVCDNRRTQ